VDTGIAARKDEQVMWDRDFLDKWDMARRIEARLFCFGSGTTDEGSGGDSPAADDTQANYEQEAFGGPRRQTDGVNFRSAPSQPREDRDPVMDIVTMGRPMTVPPAVLDTPLKRGMAESMFQDFAATLPPAPAVSPVRTGVGLGGRGTITSVVPQRVSTSYFGDLAGDGMSPTFGDVSVGSTAMPPPVITDIDGVPFDTTTGRIIPSGVTGMEDEYDPFTGTGRTAMDVLNYDTGDQSGPAGQIRPFGGLTRAQQANLEGRDDFVARNILAAQTSQPSGIPTTNLTGIFTYGDSPEGDVRGYSDFGPNLPFFGQTQVYTGFGDNPYAPPAEASDDETVPPQTNPLTGAQQCPDGYIFDDFLQACRPMTRSEKGVSNGTADTGSGAFFRRTSLDDAPANLPSGFDFDAANRRFTESYGYRPDFYRSPMSLTGFTRVS
jgi:hypothetical protein